MNDLKENQTAAGFSLLELIVAIGLGGIVMGLIVGGVSFHQNVYYDSVVRLNLYTNLAAGMDILATNVRQAGENLAAGFPAIVLENGASGAPDTLRVRRITSTDVLTVCAASLAGATGIEVSSQILPNAACTPAVVQPLRDRWEILRLAETSDTLRVYIYDRAAEQGEFVTYSNSTFVGGDYILVTSATSRAYPALTTNIYLLEEFSFSLDTSTGTLQMVRGQDGVADAVTFSVSDFQVQLGMSDGTTLTELNSASALGWKDIRRVSVTLSGAESRRQRVFTTAIQRDCFPRNVLSQ